MSSIRQDCNMNKGKNRRGNKNRRNIWGIGTQSCGGSMNLRFFSHKGLTCPSQWLKLPWKDEEKMKRILGGTDKYKDRNYREVTHPRPNRNQDMSQGHLWMLCTSSQWLCLFTPSEVVVSVPVFFPLLPSPSVTPKGKRQLFRYPFTCYLYISSVQLLALTVSGKPPLLLQIGLDLGLLPLPWPFWLTQGERISPE